VTELLSLGVLASGEGGNLGALIEAVREGRIPARVACVVCNVPGAGALRRAAAAGVPAVCLPHREHATREAFDAAVTAALREHGVELVVLAGFMRVLTPEFVRTWAGRMINVHPSLLPAFPGVHAVQQALDRRVRITGCTVHFVDEGVDSGPVIAQAAVPVLAGDDAESLVARIHVQEHVMLPKVVGIIAGRGMHLEGGGVRIEGYRADATAALTAPEVA
jgi:phosphoribosylglycinamide formyltransferase-1